MKYVIKSIEEQINYRKTEIIRLQENINQSENHIKKTQGLIEKILNEIEEQEFAIKILNGAMNVECEDQET